MGKPPAHIPLGRQGLVAIGFALVAPSADSMLEVAAAVEAEPGVDKKVGVGPVEAQQSAGVIAGAVDARTAAAVREVAVLGPAAEHTVAEESDDRSPDLEAVVAFAMRSRSLPPGLRGVTRRLGSMTEMCEMGRTEKTFGSKIVKLRGVAFAEAVAQTVDPADMISAVVVVDA